MGTSEKVATLGQDVDADVADGDSAGAASSDFAGDAMAIDESSLVAHVRDFAGFRYSLEQGNSYPWELPGIHVRTAPKLNNCCTFVEALLVKSWADAVGLTWSPERHHQMMIMNPQGDPFSPVTAAVAAGMAVPIEDQHALPPPWTVIQGWRSREPLDGGHTFILVAQHDGKILTLESNAAFGLNGVGFRGLGNAENFDFSPPATWWENQNVWDWERIRDTYRYYKLARLKVTNPTWAG